MRDFKLESELAFLTQNFMGYIDPLGGFVFQLKSLHIDPYSEENLGFFKKMSYGDKVKEYTDSLMQTY